MAEGHHPVAAQALNVTWSDWAGLPDMADLNDAIRNAPEMPDGYSSRPDRPPRPGGIVANEGDVEAGLNAAVRTVQSFYSTPYHHHGSIGPSCAVADYSVEGTTVWSGSQMAGLVRSSSDSLFYDERLLGHTLSTGGPV